MNRIKRVLIWVITLIKGLTVVRLFFGIKNSSADIVRSYENSIDQKTSQMNEASKKEAQLKFLEEMEHRHKVERDQLKRTEEILNTQEHTIHILFVSLAVVCICFMVFGGYLMFEGKLVGGILSELLGIISGVGTKATKPMVLNADKKRNEIANERKKMLDTLLAIQGVLATGGEQLEKTAEWLRELASKDVNYISSNTSQTHLH